MNKKNSEKTVAAREPVNPKRCSFVSKTEYDNGTLAIEYIDKEGYNWHVCRIGAEGIWRYGAAAPTELVTEGRWRRIKIIN